MSDTIILHMSDLHFSSNEEKKREKDVHIPQKQSTRSA